MSLTPKDMDFIEAKHVAAREIASPSACRRCCSPSPATTPTPTTRRPPAPSGAVLPEASNWGVLPLVTRTAKALSTWLSPAYGGPLDLRPDLDAIEALNPEREALWARLEKATFLTPNEKRAAVGYGSIARGDEIKSLADHLDVDAAANLSYKYPGQPRNALGQFDFGQNPDGPQPAQDRRGFLIDLTEHEGPITDPRP